MQLPQGKVGEVCIRGDNVTKGYLNRPEANEEAFAGGWFHTGDQVCVYVCVCRRACLRACVCICLRVVWCVCVCVKCLLQIHVGTHRSTRVLCTCGVCMVVCASAPMLQCALCRLGV